MHYNVDINNYRPLTHNEINVLKKNGCQATDWNFVKVVKDGFNPDIVEKTAFRGNVYIGENCYLKNISHLDNYVIGNNCVLQNIVLFIADKDTTFGVGTQVEVLREDGSISIAIHPHLTMRELFPTIHPDMPECTIPPMGMIGEGVVISGVYAVRNVCIGAYAHISDIFCIENSTVLSDEDAGVQVLGGGSVHNCVLMKGATLYEQVIIENCFVGEGTSLSKGFTAEHCIIGPNCVLQKGEACASICGPFTVSHHKSSLIIGCQLSYANIGSGTNMSNHRYKMGPLHYGYLGRGCKTTSGSHIVMPVRVGEFTLIMGKIGDKVDTTAFPFSYLIGEGRSIRLIPAINALTIGTFRDYNKWPQRDMRCVQEPLDELDYRVWNQPETVAKVQEGLQILQELIQDDQESYHINGVVIQHKDAVEAIKIYELVLKLCEEDRDAVLTYVEALLKDIEREVNIDEGLRQRANEMKREVLMHFSLLNPNVQ